MTSSHFVRGGDVDPWYGSTRALGSNSFYWSATADPTASDAYDQPFNSAHVRPSNSNYRAFGFSVRCLVL